MSFADKHPSEDIAPQATTGGMIDPADNPDAGDGAADDFFIEPAEEVAPEGDRLERLNVMKGQLLDAQFEIASIEAKLEAAMKNERKLREELIPNLMKEVNMRQIVLQDGVTLKVEDDFKCGISEAHKPLAFKWLRDSSLGGVIKRMVGVQFGKGDDEEAARLRKELEGLGFPVEDSEEVHHSTLKATLKVEREAGKPIPADLFGVFDFQTTKLEFPRGMKAPPKPMFAKKPRKS
ncbi:MAG TPA: hypothetical protein VF681_14660 [Abditibacteriaceae bacterium]|jgi:hypothetical protein